MSNVRLRTALLGSGAAVALLATAVPATADELQDLRSQIESLQSRLASLETQQSVADQEQYVAAPANAVVGGDKPGSFRLPGSNTSVNIGGYAKLDLIYDFDEHLGASMSFPSILASETRNGSETNEFEKEKQDGQFRLHARQSRIWIKTWTPTDWGEFSTHIEGDFAVNPIGNERVSNSHAFRLRHAYGQLGNLLAGQTWSNFNTPWAWAGTIDFGGAVGTSFIRQAQIRYTAPLGNGLSLAVSIENPESDGRVCQDTSTSHLHLVTTSGTTSFVTNTSTFLNNCSTAGSVANVQPAAGGPGVTSAGVAVNDIMPDIVARLQYGADWGTVAVAGVLRYFEAVTTGSEDDNEWGWGVKVAAVIKLWGNDSLGVEALYGDGMGRYGLWNVRNAYVIDGNGITTIEAWGATVWLEHWWTENLYSVAVASLSNVDWVNNVGAFGSLNAGTASLHVNLQWQPVSRANIGIEYIHGWVERANGDEGDAQRIQVGFTWGFST